MRGVWRLGLCLSLGVGCSSASTTTTESYFPRHVAVEIVNGTQHLLHVTGFADGSHRIYRVNDADLTLQRIFLSNRSTPPAASADGLAVVRTEDFAGAWNVALTQDQTTAVVTGRLAHSLVRLVKDAGIWVLGSSAVEGAPVPVEIPQGGAPVDRLGGALIPGLRRPRSLALSPDEEAVYVGGFGDSAVARFAFEDNQLLHQASIQPVPKPQSIVALSPMSTSSTATTGDSIHDVLYVLTNDPDDGVVSGRGIIVLRWVDDGALVEQVVENDEIVETCVNSPDPECLQDRLTTPGLHAAWELSSTTTSSGTQYLVTTSTTRATVTAFTRNSTDLLTIAGTHRFVAPWETAMTTAADGTVSTLTATSASTAGFRQALVHNDIVYVASSAGGFIAYFPLSCVTDYASLADTAVCETFLCLDTVGGCMLDPSTVAAPTDIGAHPWGLAVAGSVLYATLDLEGKIAVIDLAADGTPTLRFIGG